MPPPPVPVKDKAAAPEQPQQTEAQAIAEATRKQAAQAAAAAAAQASATLGARRGGSQISVSTAPGTESPPVALISPVGDSAVSTPGPSSTPSIASLNLNPARRHLLPGERNWRPAGAAPAQVTVSPVTSVTTTVPMRGDDDGPPPMRLMHGHATTPAIDVTPASSRKPGGRLRRGSIGTLPDSPSSVSLSAMISANAELSQNNYSFVPGFSLPADDTRSVRSLGFTKRPGSVSKIIRRMRGEGLSKHYWMADEHCRECYDCKSVFTTWRRKHHCRICGQIFCGRCASNIIGARRFGQDGMVRVCNLCLKIMEDYDDDDDRRSINSTMSSLPERISPEVQFSASPYAASQLFTRHANESLTAIDEVPRYWNRGTPDIPERPYTPEDPSDFSDSEEGRLWDPSARPSTCAPFRRMQSDEHSDEAPHSLAASETPSPGLDNQPKRVGFPQNPHVMFPRTETMESDDMGRLAESVHFSSLRNRLSSVTSLRGLSALLDSERQDGLWRARSHSFVTPHEFLSAPSLQHFNSMLQQSLDRVQVQHVPTWHKVLSKLLLRVSTNLRPVVRAGDSIDVRTYVKIKKVPGGRISDSEYVDGIVITKNVAHKGMARRLVNPRIMVITFPLDYHRVETQFMSLDPILKQERDYLRLLTKRIVDLRPHIVLVERFVSRIALDFLYEANIVVARGVKFSAIHQVARCTHADIIASMDRLALEPRLGRCADFRVQTFEHELIPGRRKTYMRFEGTHNGFGGTIILRGGDMSTLHEVKVIADFMALVAYHLKNEAFLYGDEFHMLPPRPPMPEEYQELLRKLTAVETDNTSNSTEIDVEKEQARFDALRLSRQIAESLEPYLNTVLSASVAVRFPPPMPLAKMASLDRTLNSLRTTKEERETAQIIQEEKIEIKEEVAPSLTVDIPSPATPTPATMGHSPTDKVAADKLPGDKPATDKLTLTKAASTGDPYRILLDPDDFIESSRLAFIGHEHSEYLKIWQHYIKRHPTPLHPKDYQGIIYLQALYRQGQEKACTEPTRQQINFYQEDDQTLGQFLGSLVGNAGHRCPNKSCDQLMLFHYDVLVHADRRLQIVMEQFMCPLAGHEEQILTWSYCRQCNKSWEPTIIREETWRMSWGAYLEHCFYPPRTVTGFGCAHDAYREHIRYFAHHNMVIRIHNDEIELYEPVRPSTKIMVKIEDKVRIKNQEYESALQKTAAFFDSVLFRLRGFTDEIVDPEKVAQLRNDRDTLLTRAVADRDEIVNSLNRTYKQTQPTDVLAINVVLQALQDKVIQWDLDFLEVEKMYTPTEKDLRRMTATHLKRLFATQDVFGSLDNKMTNLSVPEVDEPEKSGSDSQHSKPPSPTTAENMEATLQLPPFDSLMSLDSGLDAVNQLDSPSVATEVASSDVTTPTPTLARSTAPLAIPVTDYDSDSTISAVPGRSLTSNGLSGMDSDNFVSRLPRRTRPAPSVADLMKRFQESVDGQKFDPIPDMPDMPGPSERPRSAGARRRMDLDVSDSDVGVLPHRPRFRRSKEPTVRESSRESSSRSSMFSDPDRSYAIGASRPTSHSRRSTTAGPPVSRTPHSRAQSPAPQSSRLAAPTPRVPVAKSISLEGKVRLPGRGKTPRKVSDASSTQASPGLIRGLPRRVINAGSRVTSIARHFDKISREAERDRQKRISQARGKRAGRVGVTKAKVQVFNNVRDAFKDEFDSDSSAADNEQDDASECSVDSTGRAKPRRKSPKADMTMTEAEAEAEPEPEPEASSSEPPQTTDETPADQLLTPEVPTVQLSDASNSATEAPRKDRLQIELAPFGTNAPLPPMTPHHLLTEDEGTRKPMSQLSQMSESEMSSGGGERSSILKTLTGLWAFRAGDLTPLEYPFSAAEHIFVDSRVIVRENEPTSIIAFTLSSKTYRDQMRAVGQAKARCQEPSLLDDVTGERQWDIISPDEALETDDMRREAGTHLKYDFEAGSSTISCRIFFAEQFAALRQACQCEDIFVESLARCAKFDASGGKSGSAFLKTKDDRFIVKEISRYEMDAITKFAPAYFDYTTQALQRGRPTALAKAYGIFKIGYRNAVTGRNMQMNVLVQENLFYSRTFSKIYDLKGSTRNRLIKPTGKPNEVLLDENLMEMSYTAPLYLRDHSKRILRTALWNDTLFLSNLNVMDYSLVVGVDTINRELVVGVVDFLRPFTWDKQIESWVKDFGGARRAEPTVITPVLYRRRFRSFMDRYLPSVPDRWDGATGGGEEGATEEAAI
jgi:1-phosphatidylinositol-3-phosphate 5-kinase